MDLIVKGHQDKKNGAGAQKTFCRFLLTTAVFDLGFLADGVKIFSLKDETANFLLDKSQVDYSFSRCSASRETEPPRRGPSVSSQGVHLPQTQRSEEGSKKVG